MTENTQSSQEQLDQKEQETYQVSARKYRPAKFSQLVGQEVLVKTISNAIKSNRIAHAFILTGIRGVGKTTTARLIAKSLNCIGPDGQGRETTEPCGVCPNCLAIANSNHQDVIEIDAASRTGVNDMREIIDNINYAPVSARYKIYIIDEVHMLSNSAFNALLKTLEEPPRHVKFIFATTEIRKVPVTILSRCQRFDLRRFTVEELRGNLSHVLSNEGFKADDEALTLLARAADGSMRDGLSLLDQAISHNEFNKELTEGAVSAMLGLADKDIVYNLFEGLCEGDTEKVFAVFDDLYKSSVDIKILLQDLMDINHQVTLAKTVPNYKDGCVLSHNQMERVVNFAEKISLGSLTRIWQLLLKGTQEISFAPKQKIAMEMLLIRICYASNLPSLEKIVAKFKSDVNKKCCSDNVTVHDSKETVVAAKELIDEAVKEVGASNLNSPQKETKTNLIANEVLSAFKDAKLV